MKICLLESGSGKKGSQLTSKTVSSEIECSFELFIQLCQLYRCKKRRDKTIQLHLILRILFSIHMCTHTHTQQTHTHFNIHNTPTHTLTYTHTHTHTSQLNINFKCNGRFYKAQNEIKFCLS